MEGVLIWLGMIGPPFLLGASYSHPRRPMAILAVGITALILAVIVGSARSIDLAPYAWFTLFLSGVVVTSYAVGRFVRFQMNANLKP